MMRIRFLFAAVLFCLCASPLAAQQQEPEDTSFTLLRMNEPPPMLRPSFVLPLSFALNAPETDRMLPLFQSFAGTPQSFIWNRPHSTDLTAPLMLQLYQPPAEKAFRMTLGAAGTAGALYLAYKRIKNHGF
jgi:hypothetical protein